MDIPIEEESAAVLEYIGFEKSTASEIFERYAGRPDPDQCPDDLLDYACAQISLLKTKSYRDMDMQEAMARVGLTQQIQTAIADPAFSDILWTRDLHFWVKDTLETNYATLFRRQELLKRPARYRIAHKNKRRKTLEPATVTATVNIDVMTQDFLQLPSAHVAVLKGDVPTRPDHVLLYKGKAYWDLRGWGSQRLIRADGSIDLSRLSTDAGGDFNSKFNALYWTPDKEMAERYRRWAARRCPRSETCLIQIQIPNTFIGRLRSAVIGSSADWKEFVWTCKQTDSFNFDYLGDVDLIKGHISTGMSLSPICVEMDRPALQWMFWKDKTLRFAGRCTLKFSRRLVRKVLLYIC
jgi:hypothetical protein